MTAGVAETFERLADAFLGASRRFAADVVAGEAPGVRYAGFGTEAPGFNRIMVTAVGAPTLEADLTRAATAMGRLPVVSAWLPSHVEGRRVVGPLARLGFEPDPEAIPAMARSLAELPPPDRDARVRIAGSPAEVRSACRVLAAAFDASPEFGDVVAEVVTAPCLESGSGLALFVLFDGPAVVSTSLAFVTGDTLAIWNVATLGEARGRGFGRLVTLAALHHGRDHGATSAVLESTELGYGVYRALGFEEVGRFALLVRRAG